MISRHPEPALGDDVRLLAGFMKTLGASDTISGFLEGFLPEVAKGLDEDPGRIGVIQVSMLGASGVGKSTLFNWMAGAPLALTGFLPKDAPDSTAGFIAIRKNGETGDGGPVSPWEGNNRFEHRVEVGELPSPVVIVDPPGCPKERGTVLGRSGLVILVVTPERYADIIPLEMARWCSLSGSRILPVLNMADGQTATPLTDDWVRILESCQVPLVGGPLVVERVSRAEALAPSAWAAARIWREVGPLVRGTVWKKPESCRHCLRYFLGLLDQMGLREFREGREEAAREIGLEGKAATREFMVAARSRMGMAELSSAGRQILELLELPGPGRIWSIGFRLSGWPLRHWLLGGAVEPVREKTDAVVRRVLGNWFARVKLGIYCTMEKAGGIHGARVDPRRNQVGKELEQETAPMVSRARELCVLLNADQGGMAREWLCARPGLLGCVRGFVALAQGACLAAAVWYGSGGLFSLIYLAVFAGLADMVLVLGVRVPLVVASFLALRRWEKRIVDEVIKPCSELMENQLANRAGLVAEALAAAGRVDLALVDPDSGAGEGK